MPRSRKYVLVVGFILACLSCLFLVLVRGSDLEAALRFPDRLSALPTVKAQYVQTIGKITQNINDTLLSQVDTTPLHLLLGNYAGCIRGTYSLDYGTNRNFAQVVQDFDNIFLRTGWEKKVSPTQSTTVFYLTRAAIVSIYPVDPSSPDYAIGKGLHQVVYHVIITWNDPSKDICTG
jgi:hypothetical protein